MASRAGITSVPVADADEIERVALRAARAAGRIHRKRMSRTSVTRKTNAVDIVTEADHEAEAAGIETLTPGFPYDRRERRRYYLAFWESFMTRVQGVRRTGSAALDLAYVACGRVDGFWEFGLKQWDIAAGSLIVEEAGGHVSNMDGATLDLAVGQIIASNGRLHQPMIEVIEAARPEAERPHGEMVREA